MSSPSPLRRHLCFLDVGHGNSTVLIADDPGVVIIDVGKQSTLSEFLDQQQITHINSIYLSHADEDHIGALVGVLATKQVSIDRVLLNGDALKNTKVWDDLLHELEAAHRAGSLQFEVRLVSGLTEELPGCVSVHVLGPSRYLAAKGPGSTNRSGQRIGSNSISAVIAVAVAGERLALLPGDLDGLGLLDLLRTCDDLRARILIYPHHGGLPGGMNPRDHAQALLAAVQPELVVFSIGRGRYRTPRPDAVGVLRETLPNARVICTQLSGHCSKRLQAHSPTHLSPAFARGLADGACCGGTVVVPLDDVAAILPRRDRHVDFIHAHAETALCSPLASSVPTP